MNKKELGGQAGNSSLAAMVAIAAMTFVAAATAGFAYASTSSPSLNENTRFSFGEFFARKANRTASPEVVRAFEPDYVAEEEQQPDAFGQLESLGIDARSIKKAALRLGIATAAVETMDLGAIDVTALDAKERRCLTEAIYYEARGETAAGRMAVADVVLNRVAHKRYPNTICDVVYQGSSRRTGCQFSFTCDGSLNRPVEPKAMRQARALATSIMGGFRLPLSKGALNYHANYVSPYWAPKLHQTAVVDNHIFYTPTRTIRYAGLN